MSSKKREDLIRARLEAVDWPWSVQFTNPQMDGPNWHLRRRDKPGILLSVHQYGFDVGITEMIENAPSDIAWLLERM